MIKDELKKGSQMKPPVVFSQMDADIICKVHRILRTGKNVEIKRDASGVPKVFSVSKEIEQ